MLCSCPSMETDKEPLVTTHRLSSEASTHEDASISLMNNALGLTRFVLFPFWTADGGGELGVTGQAVAGAVPVSPVVRVTAIPNAFAAAGSGQGQRRPLREKQRTGRRSQTRTCYSIHASTLLGLVIWDLIGGAHAGLVWDMIGPPQLFDGLSWHGLGEAQTTPCVGRGPHLSHHRLL